MTQTVRVRIAIVGTTASGKSALGERIAQELANRGKAAEIVSADSMCVYRGMDVGTAKPTEADQQRWVTHGIDLVNPDEEFSVAQFQRYALAVLKAIEGRGAVAILVGGTGLYVDAVVNNLTLPGQFPEIKLALGEELGSGVPIEDLYARLVALDPDAAAKMEPNNERRILRALEVCMGSGRRFSSFGPGLVAAAASDASESAVSAEGWILCGPIWPRPELRQRISQRFSQQLVDGFVDEAARVLETYGENRSKTARQALGYRELWDHLGGNCSLSDAIDRAVLRTGQFAVRQERWFRRDPRIQWINGEALESPIRLAGWKGRSGGTRSGAETGPASKKESQAFDRPSLGDTLSAREASGEAEVSRIVNLALSREVLRHD
jgi:tRNA dimethylallyltransferase